MTSSKKLIVALALFFGLVFSVDPVKATDIDKAINRLSVTMSVTESGSIQVNTVVEVHFNTPSSDFAVFIPQKTTVNWDIAGKTSTRTVILPIQNFKLTTGYQFKRSNTDDHVTMTISDPNGSLTGDKIFQYSYVIQLKDLQLKDTQLFYTALIGNGWQEPINEVDFTITLPKGWPHEIRIFRELGSQQSVVTTFTVADNTLSGHIGPLAPMETLSLISLVSEQGRYFSFPIPADYTLWAVAASALLFILMVLLYFRYGKDDPLIITDEFGPIKGLSSAQIGYIIDGKITPRDMVSVLIEWGYKGYLRIIDDEDPLELVFEKKTDIPDIEPEADRQLFAALFFERSKVSVKELQIDFREKLDASAQMILDHYEKTPGNQIFIINSFGFKYFLGMVSLTSYLIFMNLQISVKGGITGAIAFLYFVMIVWGAVLVGLWIKLIKSWTLSDRSRKRKLILLIAGTLAYFISGTSLILSVAYADSTLILIKTTFVQLFTLCSVALCTIMDRRSPLGTALFGKILGLRDFILTAEKDRLIALVKEDPFYFYKLLPYAYVFEITEIWVGKFDTLTIEMPKWYVSKKTLEPDVFMSMLFTHLDDVKFDMASLKATKEVGGALLQIGGGVVEATMGAGSIGKSGKGFGGGGGGHW